MNPPIEPTAEELRKFYDLHTKEPAPWDGSTFIDLTPDCACRKCSNGRFWIKSVQDLARTKIDECAVLEAQNKMMREALRRIRDGSGLTRMECSFVANEALSSLPTS